MFEDEVCVGLSGILNGRPNYANITFSWLFARPCVDRPEVMDKRLDYATALLSEFCVGAKCPLVLAPFRGARSRCMAKRRRTFKKSVSDSSFSSTFSSLCMVERRRAITQSGSDASFSSIFFFLLFCFLSTISLV